MKIYAEKFRGFRKLNIDLSKLTFLIGDNSSGKSSIIYLIEAISSCDLKSAPKFDEDFGISEYDYFSPYFDNDDVIFSFYEGSGENLSFAKIVTVSENRNIPPSIIRCSYFHSGKMLTMKMQGSKVLMKIRSLGEVSSIEDAVENHNDAKGFRRTDFDEWLPLGEPGVLIALFSASKNEDKEFLSKIISSYVPECRLVPPLRALPEKFYAFRRKFNSQGKHFASMLMDFGSGKRRRILDDIDNFGKSAKLFESVDVRKISKNISDSPLLVSVKKNGKEFTLNQMGVGVSQVVPVLLETVYAIGSRDIPILIQQPELHLHPVAQASLGSYFYTTAMKGLRGVLETHSSFLIDRFRADIRDKRHVESDTPEDRSFSNEDVQIIFCQNGVRGNNYCEIKIMEDGSLLNDPSEFHQFFIDEMMRTMF